MLTAQSGDAGGMTWAAAAGGGETKAWARVDVSGTAFDESFNMTSVSTPGTGKHQLVIATNFAANTFAVVATCNTGGKLFAVARDLTVTEWQVWMFDDGGTLTNADSMSAAYGAQ
jgi:hypothetical protein